MLGDHNPYNFGDPNSLIPRVPRFKKPKDVKDHKKSGKKAAAGKTAQKALGPGGSPLALPAASERLNPQQFSGQTGEPGMKTFPMVVDPQHALGAGKQLALPAGSAPMSLAAKASKPLAIQPL